MTSNIFEDFVSKSFNSRESLPMTSQGSPPCFNDDHLNKDTSVSLENRGLWRPSPRIFENSSGRGRMGARLPTTLNFKCDIVSSSPTHETISPLPQRQPGFGWEELPNTSKSLRGHRSGSRAMVRLLAEMPKIKLTDEDEGMSEELKFNFDGVEEGVRNAENDLFCPEALQPSDDEGIKCGDDENGLINNDGNGAIGELKHSRDEDENEEEIEKNLFQTPRKRPKVE